MKEYGCHSFLASGRGSENTHFINVHIGILFGGGFDPKYAIGEAGVFQVLITDFFEGLGAERGAHAVHFYYNKAQLGQVGHIGVVGSKRFRHIVTAGAGINVFYDGVFLVGIEVGRTDDDAPDVGFTVSAFGNKDLGRFPAGFFQFADVGLFQGHD